MGDSSNVPPTHVAIITGSAGGIGRDIALRLAKDGHDIVINDLKSCEKQGLAVVEEVRQLTGNKQRAIFLPADVSSSEEVQKLIQDTADKLGSVDIMVANAGVGFISPFIDADEDDFDRIFRINVRGTFLCYKYAARQMIKQGRGGRIVGASSMVGKRARPNIGPYAASKSAVIGLTQAAGLELWEHGITVNAYAPGIISTPLAMGNDGGAAIRKLMHLPEGTPVGRPEDIAELVSYLVRPETRFVTGQTHTVDGGVTLA